MLFRTILLSAAAGLALTATGAAAQEAGDLSVGLGLGWVHPKSDNGNIAGAESQIGVDTQVTLTLEYFLTHNIGIEVLAATPFKHDISLAGSGVIGNVKQLPPTITVNYHFDTGTKVSPFVGLGLNYTSALDAQYTAGTGNLTLDDSWGLAVHAGVDYQVGPKSQIRADLRWMDIDMDASLDGAYIGTANVDPMVAGVSYIYTF